MLSILIPTYNYNVTALVKALYQQCIDCEIKFEILVLDDGSNSNLNAENEKINQFNNCSFKALRKNIGRTATRGKLANMAKYDWFIFLDADVLPKGKTFIKEYIEQTNFNNDVIYGGIAYDNNQFITKAQKLRWKYGRKYEQIKAQKRNSKPFKYIVSGNFLIKRSTFVKVNSKVDRKSYGLDNHFSVLLKQSGASVLHIDNEVFHIGIDSNEVYLTKVEEAVNALLWLYHEKKGHEHENSLLLVFRSLKKNRINYILALFHKIFGEFMKINLLSDNTSLNILQLYKLSYMCYIDLKKSHNA
ncbi:glycosyltransferase [Hyunsoonleella rubra]|uniref:Glycosyltransferase n=1 Tax=Hyunsoonleella rubra TaxID=1737062 RepID=A0ABW5TAL0_9FLAO